jgi:hypothetical protein
MEKMHIDYWTPNTNPIGVKIVNTVNGGEATAPLGATVTGSWQSIEVDMTAFAALPNKSAITQLLIDPSAPSTLFIDNFYFYKGTALNNASFEVSKIKMYPNPTRNSFTIEAKNNIQSVSVLNMLGQQVLSVNPDALTTSIDLASFQNGVYIVRSTVDGIVSSSKIIKE